MKSVIIASVVALMLSASAASASGGKGPWNELWPELFSDTSGKTGSNKWEPADVCDRDKDWVKCAFEPKGDGDDGSDAGGSGGDNGGA